MARTPMARSVLGLPNPIPDKAAGTITTNADTSPLFLKRGGRGRSHGFASKRNSTRGNLLARSAFGGTCRSRPLCNVRPPIGFRRAWQASPCVFAGHRGRHPSDRRRCRPERSSRWRPNREKHSNVRFHLRAHFIRAPGPVGAIHELPLQHVALVASRRLLRSRNDSGTHGDDLPSERLYRRPKLIHPGTTRPGD